MKRILLATFALAATLHAQDFQRVAPKQTPQKTSTPRVPQGDLPAQTHAPADVLIPALRGVVLWGSSAEVLPKAPATVRGLQRNDVDVPALAEFEKLVAAQLGQPLSLASLNEFVRAVIVHYRAHNLPVVDVSVPPQDITSGVLQLVVVESRVGAVKAEGNHWFRDRLITGPVRLRAGSRIYTDTLQSDLDWLNRNAFRQVEAVFTPGSEKGTTDVILKTTDHFPLRVYAGYENSGNKLTGETRWQTGWNWGNAFGLGQQLSYQFTGDKKFRGVRGHSAVWQIPLPWRHTLTLQGSAVESAAQFLVNGQRLDQTGQSSQLSARYAVPLPRWSFAPTLTQEWTLGFDYKQSNSNLEFGDQTVYAKPTEVAQFSLGYNATLPDSWGGTSLDATVYWSPGKLAPKSDDTLYDAARTGAQADYAYAHIELTRVTKLPHEFSLVLKATAQFANGNLLASEQLNLGGYDGVRGFEDRFGRGDGGLLLTAELRTPSLSPLAHVGCKRLKDDLQLLAFYDYGTANVHDPLPDESRNFAISSAGLGARYSIAEHISLRADYGWVIEDGDQPDAGKGRAHIGVTVTY